MSRHRYPALFQVNTRVRLSELAAALGRTATLDDIPDAELDRLAADGFDIVWFLGVWQTGEAARRVSRSNPEWLAEYRRVLPDFREEDVCGSCFAIRDYRVHEDFGGDEALARLRQRLQRRGLRLVLDFVPNHMAPDHAWVAEHPDFFVAGTEEQLAAAAPELLPRGDGPGHARPGVRARPVLRRLAGHAPAELRQPRASGGDARRARADRPPVRRRPLRHGDARPAGGLRENLGDLRLAFWPRATDAVRAEIPDFLFLAEVYWDLEWTLQQQGFDYTYDKRLYDRLEQGHARSVREHLSAGLDFQNRMARFLENHDEPRAAATFTPETHRAAAIITFLTPGLRFFHQGQREGKRVRIPVHLGRGPIETARRRASPPSTTASWNA